MEFATRQELVEDLRQKYEQEGVILTVKRSKATRVVLRCDRGGQYINDRNLTDETRKKDTHTRRIGCEFEIVSSSVKGVWAVRKISGDHNHSLESNLAGHPAKRRLTDEEKERIEAMSACGFAPKDIISNIRKEFNNTNSTARDVYNVLRTARAKELGERKPIEALVEMISSPDYYSKVQLVDGVINCVFFMHEASVSLCKTFNTVFLLDCTYKTNKFGMPLLNVVGITSTYATFNGAFAFMHEENEAAYTWVLQQFSEVVTPKVLCTDRELALVNSIARVFPVCKNILCMWHINKNVLANCKARFSDDEWEEFLQRWNVLVSSSSLDIFNATLDAFKDTYKASHQDVWNYINTTWISQKEKFVACFVDRFPHFGSACTSRVEGNHYVLKLYIRVGTLHLWLAAKRISMMLANQRVEINSAIENQRVNKAIRFNHECFKNLIFKVSDFAMDKILGQLKLAKLEELRHVECSGLFTKSWGLPCHHYIRHFLETSTPISLVEIHEQWILDRNPLAPPNINGVTFVTEPISPRSSLMLKVADTLDNENPRAGSLIARLNQVLDTPEVQVNEPLIVVKKRGRPVGSKKKTSTTRDKSHFEYVEGSKCRVCNQGGHNSRTCPHK